MCAFVKCLWNGWVKFFEELLISIKQSMTYRHEWLEERSSDSDKVWCLLVSKNQFLNGKSNQAHFAEEQINTVSTHSVHGCWISQPWIVHFLNVTGTCAIQKGLGSGWTVFSYRCGGHEVFNKLLKEKFLFDSVSFTNNPDPLHPVMLTLVLFDSRTSHDAKFCWPIGDIAIWNAECARCILKKIQKAEKKKWRFSMKSQCAYRVDA